MNRFRNCAICGDEVWKDCRCQRCLAVSEAAPEVYQWVKDVVRVALEKHRDTYDHDYSGDHR
jgi:hypothetical protein